MHFDLNMIDSNFVMPSYREGQRECIEGILKSFASGKRFVILEAPVGSGKSAIGLTVAKFFDHTYYITIMKMLQSQIMGDFEKTLPIIDLKGRNNYPCTYYERNESKLRQRWSESKVDQLINNPPDCNTGFCRAHLNNYKCSDCFPKADADNPMPPAIVNRDSLCPYYERVGQTMMSKMALMNFSNFLFQTRMTERFGQRELLILDEGHNIEPQLLNFVSISVSDKDLQKEGFTIKNSQVAEEHAIHFIEAGLLAIVGGLLERAAENGDGEKQDYYGLLYRRIESFLTSVTEGDEWVAEITQLHGFKALTLKPVYVRRYASDYLFNYGVKVLIMSATILDPVTFMDSLGIDPNHTATYRMSNRFPVENRPIFFTPVARIVGGKAKQAEWGPKIVTKIDQILARYPKMKGIIHTHNFAIADEILAKSKNKGRMLYQKNFDSKEQMLAEHAKRTNSVIVAPAMHEGLDLKGDLSRLQIVCKVPWPNFYDDRQLARRVEIDRRYLSWLTALKLCQSTGRSIRSETDWAHTYVIDEGFGDFIRQSHDIIPRWFHESVITDTAYIDQLAASVAC